MSLYLSSAAVALSFKRLSSRKLDGKTHLERTSVLMYFLAFDAACKKNGDSKLDLNPQTSQGKINRKSIELEFTKLVLLDRRHGRVIQVSELGKVDLKNNKSPEKRISSNFLTVPLKKASEQARPYTYPSRPTAPLLKMGELATGLKWGIEYHDDWQTSLPILLSEVKDATPFTDLAIFVGRDVVIEGEPDSDYVAVLERIVADRFSDALSKFWFERINKEKVLVKHVVNFLTDEHDPLAKILVTSGAGKLESVNSENLISHINYLENLLQINNISFDPLENNPHDN